MLQGVYEDLPVWKCRTDCGNVGRANIRSIHVRSMLETQWHDGPKLRLLLKGRRSSMIVVSAMLLLTDQHRQGSVQKCAALNYPRQ